ncbi:MAG: hypothetical protein F4X39_00265 [Acidobacteriia bacterium]|nr:hypothetical protein [Terriglobia bacterium]
MDRFSDGVSDELKYYIYRLIDPRSGHTFYVGKGRGDRVFSHAKNAVRPNQYESEDALKLRRIQRIRDDGLEPDYVIHRHGICDEETALLVEAAVIDAFETLTNEVRGHGSSRYGPATAEQLDNRYRAEGIPDGEPLVVIKITHRGINRVRRELDLEGVSDYDADHLYYRTVRGSWVISSARCDRLNATPHHVLAMLDGKCVGVYRPIEWRGAGTPPPGKRQRYEFIGEIASDEVRRRYLGTVEKVKGPFVYRFVSLGH